MPNIPTATAPIIKRGSAVLANETRRSPSSRVQSPARRMRPGDLAPRGYPEANPIATAKPPTPGMRKTGRIKGSSRTPTKWMTPSPIKISDMVKKGRRAGRTTSNQSMSPSNDASKAASG